MAKAAIVLLICVVIVALLCIMGERYQDTPFPAARYTRVFCGWDRFDGFECYAR